MSVHTAQVHDASRFSRNPGVAPAASAESVDDLAIQTIGTTLNVREGEAVFSEGDEVLSVYRVKNGGVRLIKLLDDGRRQITEFLFAGEYFGLESDSLHSLTAEAIGPSVVTCYSRPRLSRLAEERTGVQKRLWQVMSQGLRKTQHHLLMLGRHKAEERVASFFLALAERSGAKTGDVVAIPVSRQDIADYLGLTVETVCRTISEMRRLRFIDTPGRSRLVIRNSAALQDLAGGDA